MLALNRNQIIMLFLRVFANPIHFANIRTVDKSTPSDDCDEYILVNGLLKKVNQHIVDIVLALRKEDILIDVEYQTSCTQQTSGKYILSCNGDNLLSFRMKWNLFTKRTQILIESMDEHFDIRECWEAARAIDDFHSVYDLYILSQVLEVPTKGVLSIPTGNEVALATYASEFDNYYVRVPGIDYIRKPSFVSIINDYFTATGVNQLSFMERPCYKLLVGDQVYSSTSFISLNGLMLKDSIMLYNPYTVVTDGYLKQEPGVLNPYHSLVLAMILYRYIGVTPIQKALSDLVDQNGFETVLQNLHTYARIYSYDGVNDWFE